MNQHECLNAIRKLQFFAIDLNLYLDNFPNCKDAIDDYKLISSKLKIAEVESLLFICK